jgi:hypothetical protein
VIYIACHSTNQGGLQVQHQHQQILILQVLHYSLLPSCRVLQALQRLLLGIWAAFPQIRGTLAAFGYVHLGNQVA